MQTFCVCCVILQEAADYRPDYTLPSLNLKDYVSSEIVDISTGK